METHITSALYIVLQYKSYIYMMMKNLYRRRRRRHRRSFVSLLVHSFYFIIVVLCLLYFIFYFAHTITLNATYISCVYMVVPHRAKIASYNNIKSDIFTMK